MLSVVTHTVLAATSSKGGSALGFLPILLIGVVFIVMISRSNKRRQAAAVEVRSAVVVGAEVLTQSGLYGTVTEVIDGDVILEVSPGVTMRYVQGAIARVINSPALPEVIEEPSDPTPDA